MKAEDTVIRRVPEDLPEICFSYKNAYFLGCHAQAEISFKAGIKEVVEWGKGECTHISVMQHRDESRHQRHECNVCWQVKLKDWGI